MFWKLGTACKMFSKQSLSVDYRNLWISQLAFQSLPRSRCCQPGWSWILIQSERGKMVTWLWRANQKALKIWSSVTLRQKKFYKIGSRRYLLLKLSYATLYWKLLDNSRCCWANMLGSVVMTCQSNRWAATPLGVHSLVVLRLWPEVSIKDLIKVSHRLVSSEHQ